MGEANLQAVGDGGVWGEGSALCAFRQCLHKTKIEFLRAFVIEDNLNLIPETKDC